MHAMLADVFGMHEVRENDCFSQMELQSNVVDVVHEDVDEVNTSKFYSLLKEVEKPFMKRLNKAS